MWDWDRQSLRFLSLPLTLHRKLWKTQSNYFKTTYLQHFVSFPLLSSVLCQIKAIQMLKCLTKIMKQDNKYLSPAIHQHVNIVTLSTRAFRCQHLAQSRTMPTYSLTELLEYLQTHMSGYGFFPYSDPGRQRERERKTGHVAAYHLSRVANSHVVLSTCLSLRFETETTR